jgi:hypothetical protein
MNRLKEFWKDEDGSPITEFVVVAPLFFMMFFWVFELGIMTVRWAMLDRGLDLTIRDLRTNSISGISGVNNVADHDLLRNLVCENSGVLKNCQDYLYLELTVLGNGVAIPDDGAECVNRSAPADTRPSINFGSPGGVTNFQEIVYVRACYWIDPIMPFGLRLFGVSTEAKAPNGATKNTVYENGFAITAKSIYITEPNSD